MRRPPYDPQVAEALDALGVVELARIENVAADRILQLRALTLEDATGDLDLDYGFSLERSDHVIQGHAGGEIVLSVFRKAGSTGRGPGVFHIHGGGMVVGHRFLGLSVFLPWVGSMDAVVVSVEYRLAPEHPDPVPVEDCYAALTWMAANAEDLGFDRTRLVVVGLSAGGGLAAGVSLLARDRGYPDLAGQMLVCPMLDDRDATVSTHQFEAVGAWNRESNRAGWVALLGDRVGGPDVSVYAAPARSTDLSGLPPTFLDVGSAEVFRDEVVSFASQIWADGGVAELHVWPGGTHGWDWLAPDSVMASQAAEARQTWAERVLRKPGDGSHEPVVPA